MQSVSRLASIMKNMGVSDVWREHNPLTKQYTWVKFNNGRVFGARLDRIYVSHNVKNRVVHTAIIPTYLPDHKCIIMESTLVNRIHKSCYWHFNNKLLDDKHFCETFKCFWETWKNEKGLYESAIQWWEIGKVQIRTFCQQYANILVLL